MRVVRVKVEDGGEDIGVDEVPGDDDGGGCCVFVFHIDILLVVSYLSCISSSCI